MFQNLPVVVVRLADAACGCGHGVDGLSHNSCNHGEENEGDLHLGDLVATEGCSKSGSVFELQTEGVLCVEVRRNIYILPCARTTMHGRMQVRAQSQDRG